MNTSDKDQAKQLNETAVKCRFFAQYWGQNVYKHPTKQNGGFIQLSGRDLEKGLLELKSIEKISQEEILYIAEKIFDREEKSIDPWKIDYEEITFDLIDLLNGNVTDIFEDIKVSSISNLYDYLRSKGYAVPFMEYSVDELVKKGWVQLV